MKRGGKMLTSFDKELLNILQTKLPISKRPFADLAEALGTEEQIVISRLKKLKEDGYLRRIGPFFDSTKLGYQGTLVALKVGDGFMQRVAGFVNRYPGATHNYEREGEFNLWFTLLTPDLEMQNEILREIRNLPGVEELISLAAKRKFKINVQFNLK